MTTMNGQTAHSASKTQRGHGREHDHRGEERHRGRALGVAGASEEEVPEGVQDGCRQREGERERRHRTSRVGLRRRMRAARALMFDFNGTLSHDEPSAARDLPAALRPSRPAPDRGGLLRRARRPLRGGDHRRLARRRWAAPRRARDRAGRAIRGRGGRRQHRDGADARGRPLRGGAGPGGGRLRRVPGRDRARRRGRRHRRRDRHDRRRRRRRRTASRTPRATCRRSSGSESAPATPSHSRTPRRESQRRRPPGCVASPFGARCPTTGSRAADELVDRIDLALIRRLLG